eukprot:754286-Hanusia_phi.AAC.4
MVGRRAVTHWESTTAGSNGPGLKNDSPGGSARAALSGRGPEEVRRVAAFHRLPGSHSLRSEAQLGMPITAGVIKFIFSYDESESMMRGQNQYLQRARRPGGAGPARSNPVTKPFTVRNVRSSSELES